VRRLHCGGTTQPSGLVGEREGIFMCSEHRPSTGVSESKEFRGRSDRQDRGIGNTKKDGKWNCLSSLLDICLALANEA
jgi:hypothetical protein